MTKFEQIGISYQQSSMSKHEANKNFQYSCRVCCNRGLQIDCDRCAIAISNIATISAFEMVFNREIAKAQKKGGFKNEQRKSSCCV